MPPRAGSKRSKASASVSPTKSTPKNSSPAKKAGSRPKRGKKVIDDDSDVGEEAVLMSSEDESEVVKEYNSDALDDESEEDTKNKKRKRVSGSAKKIKQTRSPRKKKKAPDADGESDEFDLKEGQEIVGVVVQAPKTGRVPAGQISQNTFNFLNKLKDPECNDREWFKLHDPVYRQAEAEWNAFIEEFTSLLTEVDPQIPPLPPKDVIHRIYRDIRFTNDKTPYKKSFSATFSRTGRKTRFAGYHIAIQPGNESIVAAGSWCPSKSDLTTIRTNILHNSAPLWEIINDPAFVQYFGEAKPRSDGKKRSIFGQEDELKVAPKGIEKTHKDIDLLKCRSFAVFHRFLDSEVLDPDFKNSVAAVAKVLQPFVHCLNDMMALPDEDDSDVEGDEE